MHFYGLAAFLFALFFLGPNFASAVGFADNQNFVVFTPKESSDRASQEFALQVLAKAEEYRRDIAFEWFNEELPDGAGRTVINIMFTETGNAGGTWAKDPGTGHMHKVFIDTTRERALDATLKHEIAHVVFSTKYPKPNRLPIWLEEGIASRYDEPRYERKRRQTLRDLVRAGSVPDVRELLNTTQLRARNVSAYATSVALTELLLTRGDAETLFQFAQAGAVVGWNQALRESYNIHDQRDLQHIWEQWLQKATPNREQTANLARHGGRR